MESHKMKKIFEILFVVLLLCIVGCNSSGNEKAQAPKIQESDSDNSKLPADSLGTDREETDSIPLISGSCKEGREIGSLDQYSIRMKVGTSPTDSISVRSDASCFEIQSCGHNILGKIKSGTIVYAQGPLKNADYSAGIAYAFPVKDQDGNICRAYLSYLNVEVIMPHHTK